MSIRYKKNSAILEENVSVEEAEGFLEWLINNPKGTIDLSKCKHMHTAVFQLIMMLDKQKLVMPEDPDLRAWIENSIKK